MNKYRVTVILDNEGTDYREIFEIFADSEFDAIEKAYDKTHCSKQFLVIHHVKTLVKIIKDEQFENQILIRCYVAAKDIVSIMITKWDSDFSEYLYFPTAPAMTLDGLKRARDRASRAYVSHDWETLKEETANLWDYIYNTEMTNVRYR